MDDIVIRNVRKEDLPFVVDIQVEGWKAAYRGIIDDTTLDNLSKEDKLEKRKKDFDQNRFIVAEINNQIVGFCRYVDNNSFSPNIPKVDCELLSLYVKPNLKNKGIGTKLFKYVVEEFKDKNKKHMIVWCLKDNELSKKFYTKMGGIIIGQKPFEKDGKSYLEVGFIYNL